ncbi:sulfotransferase domain-containing protein [Marivirga arenosa]|uniref:Sulfotransferase domain-containing protein n=1 Tax=Marivirga arenosa TaxID=3059076 RepID=A0AA51ZWH9_9BACT|nr:sulfotransferase domain-containing protein [Marivirga sp. BKB1-2]WNB18075.1 sulfotransferase domain-containing protein [Marivirga sp. BKB1-2]
MVEIIKSFPLLVNKKGEDLIWNLLQFLIKKKSTYKTIIISGDPRGGTTWLSDIVSEINNSSLIWEPLMLGYNNEFKRIDFDYRQYIPENKNWEEAKLLFRKTFEGKSLSSNLCNRNTFNELIKADRIIVKFCRANQLLPWLRKNFQFEYDPIYIVRHPCAVVASQLRQGGWDRISPDFKIPDCKFQEFYSTHSKFLQNINSKEKRLAAYWCLVNRIPLSHPKNNKDWITITYEDLLLDGENQLSRIEKRWNLKLPASSYEKLNKVSTTTLKSSPINELEKTDQLNQWKNYLSEKQIQDILSVLKYFNINVYDYDSMPKVRFL